MGSLLRDGLLRRQVDVSTNFGVFVVVHDMGYEGTNVLGVGESVSAAEAIAERWADDNRSVIWIISSWDRTDYGDDVRAERDTNEGIMRVVEFEVQE